MIRKILFLFITSYLLYYVIYPYVEFDTTKPNIEFLSEKSNGKYIININEKNFIKISDDHGLKDIVLYFSNKDTKNEFEKIDYYNINGKNHIIDLNKTLLKDILSGYISEIKIKVITTDSSISKNKTEKIFNVKLDNKKPYIKIISKTLFPLNKGSLIGIKIKTYDNESKIKKITVNDKENFTTLTHKNKKHISLLIPVDEKIVKDKKITIKVADIVGNSNIITTHFYTKDIERKYTIDGGLNSFSNILENLKIELETQDISIISLYKEDVNTINHVIENISNDIKLDKIKINTLNNISNPIFNNDKKEVIGFNNQLYIDNNEIILNGGFYLANKYQEIMSPLDGKVVFIDKLNILGNTIVIKSNQNLYFTFSLLKYINEDIKIGDTIKAGKKIGLPEYNNIFNANLYFSVNLNQTYVKPYYFFNKNFYIDNIQKVFNDKEKI